ncbi:MAG: ATP-binding cassette domain-containing protein [SAR86 cluster bacterium]|jgi:lipoprotein-releasing system ATP-binding protein|nr:ATP-binding cassette domain-containing protein [Gammaproteobacteria bacterium]MDG2346724.1 ATP-binding cassette domain-containing protein [SAR86 cluster bacterium]
MNKLIASNLSMSYSSANHKVEVLNDVSLPIPQGSCIGIIGSSGSGKTTLLQILAGLETPTQGSIFYNDINLSENCLEKFNVMRNELFGYAYQFHYLLDDLTVYENCELVFRISNNKNYGDRTNRILDVLSDLGIADLRDSYPFMLSGGERQRAAIARAIVHRPNFVLMDEPTGNLDQENAEIIQNLTIQLAKEHGMGIVVATHDLAYADKMDEIYRIEHGALKHLNHE